MTPRPMRVHGIEIPQPALDAARAWMVRQVMAFRPGEVDGLLVRNGVPVGVTDTGSSIFKHVASEVTNRLLQTERKAGRIAFRNGGWHAVRMGEGA